MKHPLGKGIFSWYGTERQTNRYGEFFLDYKSHDGIKTKLGQILNFETIRAFNGKRVRVIAVVLENRPSGHAGDKVLKLMPTPAKEGTEIEIGIGTLVFRAGEESFFGLVPDEHRDEMWIDPRRFYELHDQTVELFVEPTSDPAHPVYVPIDSSNEVCVDNGDGTFQLKTKRTDQTQFSLGGTAPDFENHGGGLISFKTRPMARGPGIRHKLL